MPARPGTAARFGRRYVCQDTGVFRPASFDKSLPLDYNLARLQVTPAYPPANFLYSDGEYACQDGHVYGLRSSW